MKARLVPMYFQSGRNEGFDTQVARLKNLLADEAEILAPVALGSPLPEGGSGSVSPNFGETPIDRSRIFSRSTVRS